MRYILALGILFSTTTSRAQQYISLRMVNAAYLKLTKPAGTMVEIKTGDTVRLYNYNDLTNQWKASFKGQMGYINDFNIPAFGELLNFKNSFIHGLTEKERKVYLVKTYGAKNAKRIMEGTLWLGMTKNMMIEVMGNANNINRTGGSWGIHEQWVYNISNTKTEYYYFENGKLTSWQD